MVSGNQDTTKASLNPADQKRAELKQLLPEAFSEGKLDIPALKRALGEDAVVEAGERYRLDWVGKTESYRTLQATTTATLKPMREQSVNFDTANHAFIEGENLETLKVIQKAYFGQVKLIYIDPPYNTGNDNFVYPDRFQESKEDYLRRINELDDEGALMREGQFRKNSRESGHYHSNWLSMMLPRLYIARNLLRDDGVIFVSCDDNEVFNLRCLMNEIFGEENFVASVIWQKKYTRANDAKYFSDNHDYILCYAKLKTTFEINLLPRTEKQTAAYVNPDNHSKGPWKATPLHAKSGSNTSPYQFDSGYEWRPPKGTYRRYSDAEMRRMEQANEIWFGSDGKQVPSRKSFLSEVKDGLTPITIWPYNEVGHNHEANSELKKLDLPGLFDNPKPTRLIRRLLALATNSRSGDLVLDFFAGSGTTMEAVLRQNAEDGANRRCILVQMAEPLDADNAEFSDIAQVARTRVKRALEKLRESADLLNKVPAGEGFRAFKLAPSCFPQWRPQTFQSGEDLEQQIKLFMDAEPGEHDREAIAQELLLKSGYPLTTRVETLEIAGATVYSIDEGKLLLVLETLTADMIQPLVEKTPERIITLDSVFSDSDELKTNLALQCRDAGIRFESV